MLKNIQIVTDHWPKSDTHTMSAKEVGEKEMISS